MKYIVVMGKETIYCNESNQRPVFFDTYADAQNAVVLYSRLFAHMRPIMIIEVASVVDVDVQTSVTFHDKESFQ